MTQIVHHAFENDRFSLFGFYRARARRIVPPLVAVIAATLAFCGAFMMPGEFKTVGGHGLSALSFISNIVFAREAGYFDSSTHLKWFLHTWSLSVEWQFYILYPIVLAALLRLCPSRVPAVLLAVSTISLGMCIWITRTIPTDAFYLPYTRCWEFLVGALVVFHGSKLSAIPAKTGIGLVAIFACIVGYSQKLTFPGYWAIVPVVATALVISDNRTSAWLGNRAAQFVGKLSYSLYLWHWPLVVALHYFAIRAWDARIATILACFAFAWLSHRYIDTRFQSASAANRTGHRRRVAVSAYLVVTLATMSAYVFDGLPIRGPTDKGKLVAANEKLRDEWMYPRGCGSAATVSGHAKVEYCMLGPATGQKILVWGDSHAEHLYPAFSDIVQHGANTNLQVVFGTYGGCLPVRRLDRPKALGGFDCADFNEQVFEYAQRSDVETIVISSVWTVFSCP